MEFYCRTIIGLCGFYFIGEIAEMVGLVIAGDLGGPFLTSFIPVDPFVFRSFVTAASQVSAVLGESTDTQVLFTIIQAVMVDVVHDKIVRGVHNPSVHFDAFAVFFSDCVAILTRPFGEPRILTKKRIILGIDNGKQAAGQRNPPGCTACRIGGL